MSVADARRRLGLTDEAPHGLLVFGELGMQDLDGHLLADDLVVGQVHPPHATLAEDVVDDVAFPHGGAEVGIGLFVLWVFVVLAVFVGSLARGSWCRGW